MQQDIGNNLSATNLLAHGTTVAATRQGEPGSCLAALAAEMQQLAAHTKRFGDGAKGDSAGAQALPETGSRLTALLEQQQRLARLAAAIMSAARQQTRALALARVHAQAQAWQPARAAELLARVSALEIRHQQLQAAIESDRERVPPLPQARRSGSEQGGGGANLDPVRQKGENPLDRGDGEMF